MGLRFYQEDFKTGVAVGLKKWRKVVGHLPTGGGKTVCFSAIAASYINKSEKSVLILVHRKELLKQTRKTLHKMYGITAVPIVAGKKYIPPSRVYVGMVESTGRRVSKMSDIGLVIIDEAHIAAFNKLHKYFPAALIIGVTATPISSSKLNPMKNHYQGIVSVIDVPELIESKYLAQNITRAPKEVVDRAELKSDGNDFSKKEMGEKFSNPKYIKSTIIAYEKFCKGKKTIIFNASVDHSLNVTDAFRMAGYNCRHIDGDTPDSERDAALEWLKKTPDSILCNVGIATTGFDEPTIECVIVNKATKSLALWLQMTGRGGRIINEDFIDEKQAEYPYPLSLKLSFTIIDMGGNTITHGDWCDKRDWIDIFNNPKKPSKKEQVAPVKSCQQCEAIVAAGLRICKYCGYEFPLAQQPEEGILQDFIVVTKGINVQEVIEANKSKAKYYPFFLIGRKIAMEARKKIKELGEEQVSVILSRCLELSKEWCHTSEKRFNQWHKDQAELNLYTELKKQYPGWAPPDRYNDLKEKYPDRYSKPNETTPVVKPNAQQDAQAQSAEAFIKPISLINNLYDITL